MSTYSPPIRPAGAEPAKSAARVPISTPERMVSARWRRVSCRLRGRPLSLAEGELVALVCQAACEVFKLQALYERDVGAISRRDATAQLLNFIDGDLTDIFRSFTTSAAYLLYPRRSWAEKADPTETEGELDLVVRYLDIGAMAAESPHIPEDIRAVFREVGTALSGWGGHVQAVVARIAEEHAS